jgi:hypothetical protein
MIVGDDIKKNLKVWYDTIDTFIKFIKKKKVQHGKSPHVEPS